MNLFPKTRLIKSNYLNSIEAFQYTNIDEFYRRLTLWPQVFFDVHFCISEVTVQSQINQKLVLRPEFGTGLKKNGSLGSFVSKLFSHYEQIIYFSRATSRENWSLDDLNYFCLFTLHVSFLLMQVY